MADDEKHGSNGNGHGSGAGHGRGHGGGGHGGGSHEEHEGAPEWLISFADNVVLQMGFFVILLALALKAGGGGAGPKGENSGGGATATPTPSAEQLDFAIAIREAFNNPVDIGSNDPGDMPLVRRLRDRIRGSSDAQQDGLAGRDHDVQAVRPAETYGAGAAVLFDRDNSELNSTGQEAVRALADQFRGGQTVLEIRGHCSAAESHDQEERGVRLSYERTLAVAHGLVEHGIEWGRLRLTACGDYEPVAAPVYDDEEARTNQRAEIVEVNRSSMPPH